MRHDTRFAVPGIGCRHYKAVRHNQPDDDSGLQNV